MKRLLTLLTLTVPLAYLWADTSTTGNLKLLKPSVGVVDTRRSSGDKLNSNFDIIDTSFTQLSTSLSASTTSLGAAVLGSTTALASNLQGQINFISMSQSTADAKNDSVGVDTTTLKTRINQVGIDTGTLKAVVAVDTGAIKSVLSVDSTTLLSMVTFTNNATSSNSVLNDNQNLWLSSATTRLNSVSLAITTNSLSVSNTNYFDITGATPTVKGGGIFGGSLSLGGSALYPEIRLAVVGGTAGIPSFQDNKGIVVQNNPNGNASTSINFVAGTAGDQQLIFGDATTPNLGQMTYGNATNNFVFALSGQNKFHIGFAKSTSAVSLEVPNLTIVGNLLSSTFTKVQDAQLNFTNVVFSTMSDGILNRSVPVRFSNEGSNLTNVTAVDCVGAGIDCTASGSTVTMTVAGGGGGGVTNSTFPYTMGSGGDVFQATNTFVPVPGASYFASVATETTYSFQAFTLAPSTVGSTFFKVAKASASNDAGISTSWTYVSPHMEVATGTVWSQVYSSAVRLNPGESFSVHVTSYAVTGQTAAEWGVKVQRWIEALTQ